VIVAEHAGFCFGVDRAVKLASEAANGKDSVACLGPLIHNRQVSAALAARGVEEVSSLTEIPKGGTVVLPSHGVPPGVRTEAERLGISTVDATCPLVTRAQERAEDFARRGHLVVVIGDPEHTEVKGIVGAARERAVVVQAAKDVAGLPVAESVGVIAQTTYRLKEFQEIVQAIGLRYEVVETADTLCHVTGSRQSAARGLAERCDMVLVVGGRHSANTRRLYEICKETGTETHHIETADDIIRNWLEGKHRIGVTAGASTPDWIIEEVVATMYEEEKKEQEELLEEATEEVAEEAAKPVDPAEAGGEVELEEEATEVEAVVEEAPEEEPAAAEAPEAEPAEEEAPEAEPAEEEAPEAEPAEELSEAEKRAMEGVADEDFDETMDMSAHEMYEESFTDLNPGDIVKGKVVQLTDDEILVDVGYKTEGTIPRRELQYSAEEINVGDEISVFVRRIEAEGDLLLSKRRADIERTWGKLEEIFKNDETIEAPVTREVKGGLILDVGDRGFMPASHVSRGFVKDLGQFVGETMTCRIIELDRKKRQIILSRKEVLEEEHAKKREETWDRLQEGKVIKGTVKRLTDFGAFVDLGGVDGLLHVSELSWGRVEHPSEVLEEGQEIEVLILRVDEERERVSLGYKQIQPDPWDDVEGKYPEGALVEGTVVRLVGFGAFVELEPGVDGLIHISQLADYRVATPEEIVGEGEEVKVKVLSVNADERRISLSLRDAEMNFVSRGPKQDDDDEAKSGALTLGDVFGELFEDNMNHKAEEAEGAADAAEEVDEEAPAVDADDAPVVETEEDPEDGDEDTEAVEEEESAEELEEADDDEPADAGDEDADEDEDEDEDDDEDEDEDEKPEDGQ